MKQQTLRCALPILCATMLTGCGAQTDIQALQPPTIEVQVDDTAESAGEVTAEATKTIKKTMPPHRPTIHSLLHPYRRLPTQPN